MNLLDKFENVSIRNDERISAEDKSFCETYQAAYTAALKSVLEIHKVCNGSLAIQSEIFFELPDSGYKCFLDDYSNLPDIDISYEKIHQVLIKRIVNHFTSKYKVTISFEEVAESLLPEKPSGGKWADNADDWKAYQKAIYKLVLNYSDILDRIFILLNGRSFVDRALDELKEKCHNAAWNSYRKIADYEVKKDVIRLTSYACKFNDWYSGPWELNDCTKEILRGLAHFETGTFDLFPHGFSELLGWGHIKEATSEFALCDKIKALKMFKNGRVDIRFASPELAKRFSDEYLGLVA